MHVASQRGFLPGLASLAAACLDSAARSGAALKSAVVLNDTRTQLHHGCEQVMQTIESELRARNIRVTAFAPEGRDWSSSAQFVRSLKACDLIVVNGEGTIHHARPAGRDLLKVGRLARDLDIPAVLINCTYQDNPPEFDADLGQFRGVWVRESRSFAQVSRCTPHAEIVPDVTLALPAPASTPPARIGVTDSTFTRLSARMLRYSLAHDYDFLPAIRSHRYDGRLDAVELLRRVKCTGTRLLSARTAAESIDENVYLSARNRHVCPSIARYRGRLASSKLIVAARFHSICFCLTSMTPFVAIASNSHKIEGLIDDVGLDRSRLIDEAALDRGIDIERFAFSDAEIDRVERYVTRARRNIGAMFDRIAALAR